MQPFLLLRLPLLAISEVIKSMNIIEIFLLSLASKKSQNFVMLSIPKNSLSASFSFKKYGLAFELKPADISEEDHQIAPNSAYSIREKFPWFSVFPNHRYVLSTFTSSFGTSEVEESIRKLCYCFLKTFKNTKISMEFENGTREEFAMEILRFAWDNDFPLDSIAFSLEYASSETIQELLNGCQESTSLDIKTEPLQEFKYLPPPGGCKIESLTVSDAHWVNPDDFLQCRKVIFTEEFPGLTPKYLNGLLKKIVNVECRLENFSFQLKSIRPTDFPAIVRGLSGSAIQQEETRRWLKFKRKDGLKLRISLSNGSLDLENDDL